MIARAIFCSSTVLPARGGDTIRPRWPLPIGVTRSMTRVGQLLGGRLQHQPLVRVQRRQVLEDGRPGLLLRRMAVDQLHLHQGEVLLALDRQADRPLDHQAGAQAEPANLAGRDVDVFGRGQVVVGGAAQEAVAVRQHFQRAGAAHDLAALDLPAHHGDDQLGRGSCRCARRCPRARPGRTAWASASGRGRPGAARKASAGRPAGWKTARGRRRPRRWALRGSRLRVRLPGPSSLRATAIIRPPIQKGKMRHNGRRQRKRTRYDAAQAAML